MKKNYKKGVMGETIGVFILILVISVLAGMTFLFTSSLKTSVVDTSTYATYTVNGEPGNIGTAGYTLSNYTALGFKSPSITSIYNVTSGLVIHPGNYTLTGNVLYNNSAIAWSTVGINYTYSAISEPGAYNAVNKTENSGATIINYMPLLFLAIIFGVILAVVLKIILPYINLGNQMGGF